MGCVSQSMFLVLLFRRALRGNHRATPGKEGDRMGSHSALTAQSMTKMALCVAFCCVTAWISFPLPFTPGMVTALTMAMGLTAFVLTPKETLLAIAVYLLLGLCGLPVFAAGSSGPGKLFGPVGGFMLAWLFVYPLVSALKGAVPSFRRYALVDILVGMPLTYAGGMVSMMLLMDITPWQAVMMAVVPFIPGDIIKCLAAAALGVRVNRMLEARL